MNQCIFFFNIATNLFYADDIQMKKKNYILNLIINN